MFLKILVIFLIQINLYAEKLTGDGSLSTVQILDNYLIPYSPSIDIDLSSLNVEAMISDKYINITVPDRWKWASYILRRLDIAHGQNGVYGWDKKVTQAESLKFFIKTYEYYLNNKK